MRFDWSAAPEARWKGCAHGSSPRREGKPYATTSPTRPGELVRIPGSLPGGHMNNDTEMVQVRGEEIL